MIVLTAAQRRYAYRAAVVFAVALAIGEVRDGDWWQLALLTIAALAAAVGAFYGHHRQSLLDADDALVEVP